MANDFKIFHKGLLCDLHLKSAKPVQGAQDSQNGLQPWEFEFDFTPAARSQKNFSSFENSLQELGLQYGGSESAREIKRQMLMVWNARGLVDEQAVSTLMNSGAPTQPELSQAILKTSN